MNQRSLLPNRHTPRPGFTIIEIMAALAVLSVVLLLVAQMSWWSVQQRLESVAKKLALEHANNILEAARALPYEKLDDQWAAELGLPADVKPLLPDALLGIKVETEPALAMVKRVTVEISWSRQADLPANVVKLVALFGERVEKKK